MTRQLAELAANATSTSSKPRNFEKDSLPIESTAEDKLGALRHSFHLFHEIPSETLNSFRDEVREMFSFSWDLYMAKAYPKDELQPLTCSGKNIFGELGYSLSLIDGMDTFAVMGNLTAFRRAISRVVNEVTFDTDVNVSVFFFSNNKCTLSISEGSGLPLSGIRNNHPCAWRAAFISFLGTPSPSELV